MENDIDKHKPYNKIEQAKPGRGKKFFFNFILLFIGALIGVSFILISQIVLDNSSVQQGIPLQENLYIGKLNISFIEKPAQIDDYDECEESEFMDNCKLIFFDDAIGYIIMEVDYNKFTEHLQDLINNAELDNTIIPQVIGG